MNERFKALRIALNLTQQEFGDKLGLLKSAVSKIESNKQNVTEQLILIICREFRVNEKWLRNGTGEMFVAVEDPTAAYIAELLMDVDHPLKPVINSILQTYAELNEKNKEVFEYILDEFIENLNKNKK